VGVVGLSGFSFGLSPLLDHRCRYTLKRLEVEKRLSGLNNKGIKVVKQIRIQEFLLIRNWSKQTAETGWVLERKGNTPTA